MSELMNSIVSGLVGGALVLFIERFLDYRKEKKAENIKKSLTNPNSKRLLTNELVDTFSPERNFNKVKEILGEPDKTYEDHSIFEEENQFNSGEKIYKSDLYKLENAYLKVTTQDKVSIYSITVLPFDESINIPYYDFFSDNTLINRNATLNQDFLKCLKRYQEIRTIREMALGVQTYTGAPFYKHLTLFTYYADLQNGIDELDGKNIEGFCLSGDDDAFYIYDYEHR